MFVNKLGSKHCWFFLISPESLFEQALVNHSLPCQSSLNAFILLEMLVTEKKTRPRSAAPTLPAPAPGVRGWPAPAMFCGGRDRDPGAPAASGQQDHEAEARGRCDGSARGTGQGHHSGQEICWEQVRDLRGLPVMTGPGGRPDRKVQRGCHLFKCSVTHSNRSFL